MVIERAATLGELGTFRPSRGQAALRITIFDEAGEAHVVGRVTRHAQEGLSFILQAQQCDHAVLSVATGALELLGRFITQQDRLFAVEQVLELQQQSAFLIEQSREDYPHFDGRANHGHTSALLDAARRFAEFPVEAHELIGDLAGIDLIVAALEGEADGFDLGEIDTRGAHHA